MNKEKDSAARSSQSDRHLSESNTHLMSEHQSRHTLKVRHRQQRDELHLQEHNEGQIKALRCQQRAESQALTHRYHFVRLFMQQRHRGEALALLVNGLY